MNHSYLLILKRGLALFVVAISLLSCGSPDRPSMAIEPLNLAEDLEALVEERVIPGAVVYIADRNSVLEKVVVGYRDVAVSKPMTEDTIFRLYSMSKPITSVAIMMLVENGKLALDQPASEILPEFRDMRVYESGTIDDMVTVPTERPITIRDLLLHEAGITYHFTGTTPVHQYYRKFGVMRDTPVGRTPDDAEPAHSLDELVARLGKAPMLNQPGKEFAYSYSTTVLGAIIERVTGERLDVALRQMIFAPLGMMDTGFFVDDSQLNRFVTNYMMGEDGMQEIESPEKSDYRDTGRLLDGGGAIAGTASDYLRFARMLANGGELDHVRLLSASSVHQMFEPHTIIKGLGPEMKFGFGFSLGDEATSELGLMPDGAIGWSGSGNTFFWLRPDSGEVVIFMTQVITPPPYFEAALRIRKITNAAADRLFSGS